MEASKSPGSGNPVNDRLFKDVLVSLRKIIQEINMHSRTLGRKHGRTGPQLIILQELSRRQSLSVTERSRAISLSRGTVTTILARLENKNLIPKKKSERDMEDRNYPDRRGNPRP